MRNFRSKQDLGNQVGIMSGRVVQESRRPQGVKALYL